MAKLRYRYGAMGSSKTALALMLAYNYREKGMRALLAKPEADTRSTKIWSRVGIEAECIGLSELCGMSLDEISAYDCVIVDEVQFATEEQVGFLAGIVDHLGVPVFAYGLKTDYRGLLFEGSKRMLELADEVEEIECACWCGAAAKFSAKVSPDGEIIRNGDDAIEIDEIGDKGPHYVALCRKHYMSGRVSR